MSVEASSLPIPASSGAVQAALDHLIIAREIMSGRGENIAAYLTQLAIDEVEMILRAGRA